MIESLADAKLDVLIDASAKQWNHHFIDGVFVPKEAELIKNIPLSRMEGADGIFWPFMQKGEYSCKSGYQRNLVTTCPKQS